MEITSRGVATAKRRKLAVFGAGVGAALTIALGFVDSIGIRSAITGFFFWHAEIGTWLVLGDNEGAIQEALRVPIALIINSAIGACVGAVVGSVLQSVRSKPTQSYP